MKFVSAKDEMYQTVYAISFVFMALAPMLTILAGASGAAIAASFLMLLFPGLLMAHIYFRTFYLIENDCLIICSGPFRTTIELESIKSVKHMRSVYTAPALSRTRLQIRYAGFAETQISPADEAGFLQALGITPARA